MNFLIVPVFLILIIGSLSVIFIYNLQSVNPQSDKISSIPSNISVKIISPSEGEKVPAGKLTISGISSDNQEKNCIIHVDWNDLKPFQLVRAAGPGGIDDFSKWIFTYDSNYHEIIEGSNELTSKITCIDGNKPLTKWNSINVTGYTSESSSSLSIRAQNTTKSTTENQKVPLQTVMPGSNPKYNASDTVIDQNTTTSFQLSNVLPVEKNTTISTKSTTENQKVPLQTVMPGSNPKYNASDTVIDQNTTTSFQLSNPNSTTIDKNTTTTSSQLSNLSDSKIEMVVPNESLNEKKINNTNISSISENEKSSIKNFTTNEFSQSNSQKPRIDLDEQPPTVLEEEQQPQQPPTVLEEEQQPPTVLEEEQQPQQPPTVLEEEQQPQQPQPNLNNRSEAFEDQPQQSENSPTKGIFPPFKLPSLFP